ncbi:arginase family protein [Neobacillus mesonae]|uniref:arginase family protein n=1 Tax=Neobacillus mesonae TaxID=1193713 RepID=UPI00203ECE1B|nr:arginase family protein [Neobacillus mesonae]MCM3569463.1 arginase family protein [Neobacillus mesonae]
MGLIRNGISIMHFDETYYAQSKLLNYKHEDLDFRHIQHVNLFCEEDSLTILKRYLKKRAQMGITFIGSGNFHYMTYLMLKEITKPFTLVLFDNHPDLGMGEVQGESLLSCGSWVAYALNDIPLLQQVVIIGPTTISKHPIQHRKVTIFPLDERHHYSLKSILSTIHTQNIYISIDKDVLNTAEVETNWDQGMMKLDTLTHYLEMLIKSKQVEGIDICGEEHISPVDMVLPDYQAMIHKNEHANLEILQTCLKAAQQKTIGA